MGGDGFKGLHRCGNGGHAECAAPACEPAQRRTPPALLVTSVQGDGGMQTEGRTASQVPHRIGSCRDPGPGEWDRLAHLYDNKNGHGQVYVHHRAQ